MPFQNVLGSVAITNSPAVSIIGPSSVALLSGTNILGSVNVGGSIAVLSMPAVQVTPVQFGLSSVVTGQRTMSLSIPFTLASDQPAMIGTMGQKTMSLSVPMTLASDQPAISVSGGGLGSVNILGGSVALLAGTAQVGSVDVRATGTSSVAILAGTAILGSVNVGGGVTVLSMPVNTGRVQTTNPPGLADGASGQMAVDYLGKQIVTTFSARSLSAMGSVALQGTTETVLVAAGGSTVFHDLVMLLIANQSSTFNNVLNIRGALASSILLTIGVPAGASGAYAAIPFTRPIEASGRNMAWTAQLRLTNPNSVFVSAQVVKIV